MKKVIVILLLFSSFCSLSQETKKKMAWGVNGHALSQEAYLSNASLQVSLLKELGVKYYRFDIGTNDKGIINNEKYFTQVFNLLNKNSIKIVPVVFLSLSEYPPNETESYKKGYSQGYGFSSRYKNYFSNYEIGNEEGSNLLLSSGLDGTRLEHYNLTKAKIILQFIKGFTDGILINQKGANIIINEGWVHYGFFDLLEKYKVKYTTIGYHWYSDMGNLDAAANNYGNVVELLAKRYNKPIWITEINVRKSINPSIDNRWMSRNINFAKHSNKITGFFIYELFDEENFNDRTSRYYAPSLAFYGLVKWNKKYSSVTRKEIFKIYQKAIR